MERAEKYSAAAIKTKWKLAWGKTDSNFLEYFSMSKTCLMLYANNRGADQPAHQHLCYSLLR